MRTLLAFFLSAGLVLAQDPSSIPRFRVDSKEILIEFLAIDKQGHFVDDLTADEIQLKVDGKKIEISHLLRPRETGKESDELIPHFPSEIAGGNTAEPLPLVARTAIVLDSRVLGADNFSHSVQAMRRFIQASLNENHLVMIAAIERQLRVLVPFTRDRDTLLKAVDELKPSTLFNPIRSSGDFNRYIDELEQQLVILRESMHLLCYSLSGVPGRKHVVFFSEGYPMRPLDDVSFQSQTHTATADAATRQALSRSLGSRREPNVLGSIRDVVSLANSFGVSFYTVDARGLVAATPFGQADEPGPADTPGENEAIDPNTFRETLVELQNAQNTLLALAAGTNGSAFFNRNDLEAVLHASTREQHNVYLASFTPADSKKKEGSFHKVSVDTSRKDVWIRSQAGFTDIPAEALLQQRLHTALAEPELFDNLTPILNIERENEKSTRFVIGIPGSQVAGRSANGNYEIEIVFYGQIFDEEGKPIGDKLPITRGFGVALSKEQFQSLAAQPLLAQQSLELPAGKYRIVLVVEDRVAGSIGAKAEAFQVR